MVVDRPLLVDYIGSTSDGLSAINISGPRTPCTKCISKGSRRMIQEEIATQLDVYVITISGSFTLILEIKLNVLQGECLVELLLSSYF